MRFIHTSDWHLGQHLYGRKRYNEFSLFLDWLADYIESGSIDALLVCGDIFDTTTPGNRALSLYYRFLHRIAGYGCQIVIIAGNHDSPTLLEAPKELLNQLDIHVIGSPKGDLKDQVFFLPGRLPDKGAIVCAIPFLRDRDIRSAVPGEDIATKSEKLNLAIRSHYLEVCKIALETRRTLDASIPIIGTGHLFTAGGQTTEGDGVRELYIGGLAHLHAGAFPDCLDYLALGHLHIAQKVQGLEKFRYSGSPLPMGFNEGKRTKNILDVTCTAGSLQVEAVNVPVFQELKIVHGDLDQLTAELQKLKQEKSSAWLEIRHKGLTDSGRLRDSLFALVADTPMAILRIRTGQEQKRASATAEPEESLEDLTIEDVFTRRLESSDYPKEFHRDLLNAFREVVSDLVHREQDDR